MDEMKIRTSFTKGLISKILKNIFHKKTGCHADIMINDISISNEQGTAHVHLDVCVDMSNSELKALLHSTGLI